MEINPKLPHKFGNIEKGDTYRGYEVIDTVKEGRMFYIIARKGTDKKTGSSDDWNMAVYNLINHIDIALDFKMPEAP